MTDRDIKTIELIINNEQAKKRLDELKVKFEDLKVKLSISSMFWTCLLWKTKRYTLNCLSYSVYLFDFKFTKRDRLLPVSFGLVAEARPTKGGAGSNGDTLIEALFVY